MAVPREPSGPPRLRHCEPGTLFPAGVWRVESFELAAQIAHLHANVLKAVRAALRDEPGLAGEDIRYAEYQTPRSRRLMPCCLLSRVGLMAVFRHLHSVPACPDIRAVLREYHRLFDEREAPDEAIAPPDPEPADLFEPADAPPSWRINAAVETLRRTGLPAGTRDFLVTWNRCRCHGLQARARSWGEVDRIYATDDTGAARSQEP